MTVARVPASDDVVILSAARTPIGAYRGGLAPLAATALGSIAIRAAVARARIDPLEIDEVFMGQVVQAGAGQAPARQASLGAGLSTSVPCTTINKVCGSGLKAVMVARSEILAGAARLIVAGGMESMSNAPFLLRGDARGGIALGDRALVDANLGDGLIDPFSGSPMGACAERTAVASGLTREEQDAFALASYAKALAARARGAFDAELVPVEVRTRGGTVMVERDETPRETSAAALAALASAFVPGGAVTAGNSSKVSDGAAALVVASAAHAAARGLTPLARIVAQAQFAHEPERFLLAPSGAIRNVLERAGWTIREVDLFEINEAFSGIEAVRRELGISPERLNVNGGAVALGHPVGATGARLLVTLIHALRARGLSRGVVAICLGGGEAVAVAIEAP